MIVNHIRWADNYTSQKSESHPLDNYKRTQYTDDSTSNAGETCPLNDYRPYLIDCRLYKSWKKIALSFE